MTLAGEAGLAGDFVDVSRLAELNGVMQANAEFHFGGATTWGQIARSPLRPAFDALKAAAREVGSIQIQNRATIAGNLCNASPAADGVPPLLALDAEVELVSVRGRRRLPLAGFIGGPRRTELARDEILAAAVCPAPPAGMRSTSLGWARGVCHDIHHHGRGRLEIEGDEVRSRGSPSAPIRWLRCGLPRPSGGLSATRSARVSATCCIRRISQASQHQNRSAAVVAASA